MTYMFILKCALKLVEEIILNYSSLYIKGLMAQDFKLVNYIQIGPSCPSKVCERQEHNSCSESVIKFYPPEHIAGNYLLQVY